MSYTHTFDPGSDTYLQPVVEVKPTNGTLEGFQLDFNGQVFTVSPPVAIASGQTVTVNSQSATVTKDIDSDLEVIGAYDPTKLFMNGVTGIFPQLVPGITNSVVLSKTGGTATSVDVKITYRKQYRR